MEVNANGCLTQRCRRIFAGSVWMIVVFCFQLPLSLGDEPPEKPSQTATSRDNATQGSNSVWFEPPTIHPDRRISFRVGAPDAHDVQLGGEFGKRPLTKNDAGIWSVTIDAVASDIYSFHFLIDGAKVAGKSNEPFKTPANSLSLVPGESPQFFEDRPVPRGTLHQHWYRSERLGITRRVHVYTPPDYDSSSDRLYPVLYLLHGSGNDDTDWSGIGRCNAILDNLLAQGQAQPMILVMPMGHVPDVEGGGLLDWRDLEAFRQDLVEAVIPLVESHYHVHSDAQHRAIAGASMGGYQALFLGLGNLDIFSRIAGFSAYIPPDAQQRLAGLVADSQATNTQLGLLWSACGKRDGLLEGNQSLHEFLEAHEINHTWNISDDGHSWRCWRPYFRELVTLLSQDW